MDLVVAIWNKRARIYCQSMIGHHHFQPLSSAHSASYWFIAAATVVVIVVIVVVLPINFNYFSILSTIFCYIYFTRAFFWPGSCLHASILKQFFFLPFYCFVLRPAHGCHGDFVNKSIPRVWELVGILMMEIGVSLKRWHFSIHLMCAWGRPWQAWYFSTFIIRSKRRAIRNH